MNKKLYGNHMEIEGSPSDIHILAKMEMKLYGNHMGMEKRLFDMENIS